MLLALGRCCISSLPDAFTGFLSSPVVMKPHALAVCLHISRVMVSAYCRASFVAPLFMKSIFSTMVDTSGMGVVACATEDCRKGPRTFQ